MPGGKAAYPSSVLMNALPAKVAGVGEIIMVSPAPDGEIILALAPAGTWLPASRAGTGIFVTDKHLSAGTILPGTAGMLPATKFRALGLLDRAATGCAPVGGSALQVCTSQATPLFTLDDFIRLLIFGLLLAAPMLVILGLMNQLSRGYWIKASPSALQQNG